MATEKCPRCGLVQDPEKPQCIHMAGKKGGRANFAKHGREHYAKIGAQGGASVLAQHGVEHYTAMGRKGGIAVRDERGVTFYEEIGRKGGQRIAELVRKGKAKP
jgi:general stress protein YciG